MEGNARKNEMVAASQILEGPPKLPAIDKTQLLQDLQVALYCFKVCSCAQGIGIIKAASEKMEWALDLSLCARMWRGGCILRARLLNKISTALARDASLVNLMMDPTNPRQMEWRRVMTAIVAAGITCPTLSASLAYYGQYCRASLPASMTQAQR